MQCPKCKSDDIVKLSVIHSAGLSDLDANSHGRTVTLREHGLSFGSNNLKTTGTLQTRLSRLADPPRKKSYRIVLLIWFLGLAIAGWILAYATTVTHAPETRFYQQFRWFTYAYSFLAALVLAVFWRYNHRIFPRESEIWSRSFICRCCGEILRPSVHRRSG